MNKMTTFLDTRHTPARGDEGKRAFGLPGYVSSRAAIESAPAHTGVMRVPALGIVCLALLTVLTACGVDPEGNASNTPTTTRSTSDGVTMRVERVADGLTHPWDVGVLPDGALLVTERPGRLTLGGTGMGQLFNDAALAIAGHTSGGPAKVSVLFLTIRSWD